jgi:hypothetical protein
MTHGASLRASTLSKPRPHKEKIVIDAEWWDYDDATEMAEAVAGDVASSSSRRWKPAAAPLSRCPAAIRPRKR